MSIKVDLITGFLGSGKTTFLLKYARYLMKKGLKIGILEYDYGSINVDMMLLSGLRSSRCELEMIAAACDEDCLRRRFQTKLISMAMTGYDRVIIEPSGVFDMDMFFDALRDDPLESFYEIGSVITVIDAGISKEIVDESKYILASQAANAGVVLLSKVQLYPEEITESTIKYLENAASEIKCNNFKPDYIIKAFDDYSDEDFESFMNSGFNFCDYVKKADIAGLGYSAVSILDHKNSLNELKEKIDILFASSDYGNVTRVKGFVLDNGINYQISATTTGNSIEPASIGSSVLIIIGYNLNEAAIKELMQN